MNRRALVCAMTGASRAQRCASWEAAERLVREAYPNAHREGASGGWSWTIDGVCVAATAIIEKPPYWRHWLALRPKKT